MKNYRFTPPDQDDHNRSISPNGTITILPEPGARITEPSIKVIISKTKSEKRKAALNAKGRYERHQFDWEHPLNKVNHNLRGGPIPTWWLKIAWTECRPTAVMLGLLIFHWKFVGGNNRKWTVAKLSLLGVNRFKKREALEDLYRAQLIIPHPWDSTEMPTLDLKTRKPPELKHRYTRNAGRRYGRRPWHV